MSELLQRDLLREVVRLTKSGQAEDALSKIGDALRRRQLDPNGIEKAGTLCRANFAHLETRKPLRVLLLGQCTTTWLGNALTALAWGESQVLDVSEGAYDNVLQELLLVDAGATPPDVVILLPWNQRLLFNGSGRSSQERVEDECAFWQQAWTLVTDRLGARVLQVGYDWLTPGALGYLVGGKGDGDVAVVRAVNDSLRRALPTGMAFVDLELISGVMGRERFYDPRRYFWTKQPFSEVGTVRLAEHLAAALRASVTGPKKVLVLDLDNTVWGGVVGETGPLGVTLGEGPDGEAFRAFQQHAKRLTDRGIVLAVCSKNNDADARAPFQQNPGMVLSLDDIAHFEASWDPKAMGIRRIAKTLQLGLDSFVFFDDNPAEREHIRQALPEVAVAEVPEDPAEYTRALDAGLWFEAVDITGEDRVRVEQYRSEQRRRAAEVAFESIDSYLESLGMFADVREIDETDLDRVVQLIGKTNQFNLTTRRHSLAQVRTMVGRPDTIGLTLRLTDRFGDYGLVSVILAVPEPEGRPNTLEIDTWLMSCRVISRTVEEFFFNWLVDQCRRRGANTLIGSYSPTPKNALVEGLYPRLGFSRRSARPDGAIVYDLDVKAAAPARTFVQVKDLVVQGVVA